MPDPESDIVPSPDTPLVWAYFNRTTRGTFVEVGANHPVNLNQTWLLEQNGWTGVLVEPQAHCCEALRKQRPGSKIWQAACSTAEKRGTAKFLISDEDVKSALAPSETDLEVHYTGTETVRVVTLTDILDQEGIREVDFLSVDVEGFELEVFQGLDFKRLRPRLILVEDHVHNLHTHRYLKSQAYKLVNRTGLNNWYIPEESEFPTSTPALRWKLFRKMVLGLPVRSGKAWLKRLFRKKA